MDSSAMDRETMGNRMGMGMSKKTGYFSGHAVAATCFCTFGIFHLLLTLKRARNLPPGMTFCEAHVPEKNPVLLVRGGIFVIFCTIFGLIWETPGWENIEAPATHDSLYLSFMFVGVTAMIEGLGRLPQDSVRCSLVLCILLHYVLWNEHALMKVLPADIRLHTLLSQLCLAAAAILMYSIKFPKSTVAYVLQPAICILMGTWLYTGGVYAAFIDIPVGMIGILLVWQALMIGFVILLGAAFLVPSGGDKLDASYSSVSSRDDMEAFCP